MEHLLHKKRDRMANKTPSGVAVKRQRDVEDIEAAEPPAGSKAKAVSPWQGVSAQRTGVKTPIGWPKCFLVIPLLHKKRPGRVFFCGAGRTLTNDFVQCQSDIKNIQFIRYQPFAHFS